MSYDEYVCELKETGLSVHGKCVCLKMKDGLNIMPSLNIDRCMANNWDAEEVKKMLEDGARECPNEELSHFVKAIEAGSSLNCRWVVTTRELNEDVIYRRYLNLKCVPTVYEGDYTVKVTRGLLKVWGALEEDFLQRVPVHQDWVDFNMVDFLVKQKVLTESNLNDFNNNVRIITSEKGVDGAAVLLDSEYLHKYWEKYGDCYVLPSSRHEVLTVPMEYGMSTQDMKNMVRSVNAEAVSYEDYLSDSVYVLTAKGLNMA